MHVGGCRLLSERFSFPAETGGKRFYFLLSVAEGRQGARGAAVTPRAGSFWKALSTMPAPGGAALRRAGRTSFPRGHLRAAGSARSRPPPAPPRPHAAARRWRRRFGAAPLAAVPSPPVVLHFLSPPSGSPRFLRPSAAPSPSRSVRAGSAARGGRWLPAPFSQPLVPRARRSGGRRRRRAGCHDPRAGTG